MKTASSKNLQKHTLKKLEQKYLILTEKIHCKSIIHVITVTKYDACYLIGIKEGKLKALHARKHHLETKQFNHE